MKVMKTMPRQTVGLDASQWPKRRSQAIFPVSASIARKRPLTCATYSLS